MNEITAYVDGSYDKKTHRCSYGVVILHNNKIIAKLWGASEDSDMGYANMRNVGGEVLSALKAMSYAYDNEIKKLNIYYDYLGIGKWALGEWKTNNEYTSNYRKQYNHYKKFTDIEFHKVKSHSGDIYNDLADELAKKALGISIPKKKSPDKELYDYMNISTENIII